MLEVTTADCLSGHRLRLVAWSCLLLVGCGPQSLGPDPVAVDCPDSMDSVEVAKIPYDGRGEAPCPAEAVASLVDQVIGNSAGQVSLALVWHPEPSTQPANKRATWVCSVEGMPLLEITQVPEIVEVQEAGLTARALARAREFIAEREQMRGRDIPLDWHLPQESLLPAYQSAEYGLQITEIQLIDRETESWKITAKPIREGTLGGIIWMRFSQGHEVSAEYGR